MTDQTDVETSLAVLRWYAAMGADEFVQDAPVDWLTRGPDAPGQDLLDRRAAGLAPDRQRAKPPARKPEPAPAQPGRPPSRSFVTESPDAAVMAAREAAATAQSLGELEDRLRGFDGCGLKATAKNLCFFRGNPAAPLMLIGEAPGRDEDLAGKPFVGPAGKLLDKMLAAIGLSEESVHITNVVYWRPPGNRTPSLQETQVCRPFLERQVALVQPKVIVLLGGSAAKSVYGTSDGIMRLRGKWRDLAIGDLTVNAMATLHPAYLLRTPAHKKLAWRDLLLLKAKLAEAGGSW